MAALSYCDINFLLDMLDSFKKRFDSIETKMNLFPADTCQTGHWIKPILFEYEGTWNEDGEFGLDLFVYMNNHKSVRERRFSILCKVDVTFVEIILRSWLQEASETTDALQVNTFSKLC